MQGDLMDETPRESAEKPLVLAPWGSRFVDLNVLSCARVLSFRSACSGMAVRERHRWRQQRQQRCRRRELARGTAAAYGYRKA